MPRKTDSKNPADWLLIVESDLELLRVGAAQELAYAMCRSKLAETVEKIIKAELIRNGWELEKTHDLERLRLELEERKSDLEPLAAALCDDLAEAYFTDRYPGFDLEDPDWPKVRGQLQQGAEVFEVWFAGFSGQRASRVAGLAPRARRGASLQRLCPHQVQEGQDLSGRQGRGVRAYSRPASLGASSIAQFHVRNSRATGRRRRKANSG